MAPRLLVTGPVDGLREYAGAARAAGWEALQHPLLAIEPQPVDLASLPLERCELVCVTSSNALPFLERLARQDPLTGALPVRVVGERTAERARALRLRVEGEPAGSAAELGRTILAARSRPRAVLWPRGDKGAELGELLRSAGIETVAPIVYASRPCARAQPIPDADAVFFASPSAVSEWCTRDAAASHPARLALAIGPTTFDALRAATGVRFRDILSLPRPDGAALTSALERVDRRRLAEPDLQP